jgi:pyruvate dehydrogenase E1 component alpha subunit
MLKNMLRVRRMEELCAELYTQEKIRGFLHLYIGEEAVATGVLAQVRPQDNVIATYREHGHALLKGVPANAIMAEMFGKVDGCSRGRGGSMHLFSREHRFFGGNAIVGGGIPQAVGLALAAKQLNEDRLTFCFFGEGAMAEGAFHESANLAALWQLPVIFCCENNRYAMGTALARSESQTSMTAKASAYNIAAQAVDGMNPLECYDKTEEAIQYVRSEKKPYFLEFNTYRFRPHSMFDPELYRPKSEVEEWKKQCPIASLKAQLLSNGSITEAQVAQFTSDIEAEMQAAVAFAENSPWEPLSELERFVYSEATLPEPKLPESTLPEPKKSGGGA